MFDLTVIGDCNVDVLVRGRDYALSFGQVEKYLDETLTCVGGSAAISAMQAAKLGLKTQLVSVVGDDLYGSWLVGQLTGAGVDCTQIATRQGHSTGVTLCFLKGADRAMLTAPGVVSSLATRDFDLERTLSCRHIHLGSYFLNEGLHPEAVKIFETARRLGVGRSIDPNWDPNNEWDSNLLRVLPMVDYIFANSAEVHHIFNRGHSKELGVEPFSSNQLVVEKRGDQGATLFRRGKSQLTSNWPLTVGEEIQDSIGAGDCFNSGFIFGKLMNLSDEQSLEVGCICGARSTLGHGGTGAQITLEQLERLVEVPR